MDKTKHLDLGSGYKPRNPYDCDITYAADVLPHTKEIKNYSQVNLFTNSIPFDDDTFDSVSAYDFLEHVPRVWLRENGETIFPFISLMNEIYRVLKNRGKFYAFTPYYPKAQVFQDPTHVNFITVDTHEYFCGEDCLGRVYGFNGNFEKIRVETTSVKLSKKGLQPSIFYRIYDFKRKLQGKHTHLIWELIARK
jgi:SAM-dependent methyltransferase